MKPSKLFAAIFFASAIFAREARALSLEHLPLTVSVAQMDPSSRQIDFEFNEDVIPSSEQLKGIQAARAKGGSKDAVGMEAWKQKFLIIKEGLSKKKSAVLNDDEVDKMVGTTPITPENYPLVVERIKGYISSKISFEPPLKGAFVWNGPRTLSFVPEPNQLTYYGMNIAVKIVPIHPYYGKDYTSQLLTFDVNTPELQKVANWSPTKGAPRFIGHLGHAQYTNYIGKGLYFLQYDQNISLKLLRKHLTLTKADGSSVGFTLSQPTGSGDAFAASDFDFKHVAAITVDEALKDGDALLLQAPTWTSDAASSEPSFQRLNLIYQGSFKLLEALPDGQLSSGKMALSSRYVLSFNSVFSPEAFRKALVLSPAPLAMDLNYPTSSSVRINLTLAGGKSYQLSVGKAFSDNLGNPLAEPISLSFSAQDLPSAFVVPQQSLMVEKEHISVPFKGTNLASVELHLHEFASATDYIKAKHNHGEAGPGGMERLATRVLSYTQDLSKQPLNEAFSDSIALETGNLQGSKLGNYVSGLVSNKNVGEGFKLLELVAHGRGSEKSDLKAVVMVDVSDIGITAKVSRDKILVWLASFADGQPLPKTPVKLIDAKGKVLGEALSDDKGVAVIQPSSALKLAGEKTYYLVANDRSIMALRNDELSNAWQFNQPGNVDVKAPLRGALFTERGVYRPGEKAFIKCYSYTDDDSHMSITVKDPRSKEIFKAAFKRDEFGAADFKVEIPEGAAVGDYDIIVSNGSAYLTHNFKVEEYRVPTFEVGVDDGGQKWVRGQAVKLGISSKYYHGGSMGSREYKWQLSRTFAPMQVRNFPGYIFQSAADETASGIVGSGDGSLDEEGKGSVSFVPDQNVSAGRMNYTFEATVTDNDRQAYSNRVSRLVSPADVYIGIKPPAKEVLSSGSKVRMPFVAVDADGKVVSGRAVELDIERIEYHQSAREYGSLKVQMLNRMVGSSVFKKSLRTGSAPQDFEYLPEQAGIYRFNFSAADDKGEQVRTFAYVMVAGDEPIAWPRFDYEKIELVKDKELYQVGETAHLVPQSPYKRATGLLTVEVNGVLSTRIVSIKNNSPEFEVPILAEYAPNAYVSLVLVRGRQHYQKDALGFETGAPGFKIGYANLVVDPSEKRLQVDLDRSVTQVSPRKKLSIPLQVTDAGRAGVPAQLTVMVVDEAVLAMTGYKTPDVLEAVYKLRSLGVRNGSNWLDLPHSRRERLEALFPAGDNETGIVERNDLNVLMRNLFKSTAYWEPKLLTDAQGKASIDFSMPDNLSTYRVMVVAADKKQRFASADHKVTSQQPLMVQPVLPRFLYPEDELKIEAMVFNNTAKTETVTLKAELSGLALNDDVAEKTAKIEPGKSANIPFAVKVGPAGTAVVRFLAASSANKDAGEFKLPIRDPGSSHTELFNAKLGSGGLIEAKMPEHYVAGTAKAELQLSVTQLTELREAVNYVMQYPNGCIEQTTSSAYPLVILKELLPLIGVEVDQAKLKEYSEAGVKRILSFQVNGGGLSYWPEGKEPHAFATSFGLTALLAAKERGYNVPDKALKGMADYLEQVLRQGVISEEMPHASIADADTRAIFVMTLGRMGRPQPQYINALWEKRDKLTPFGLSFLAVAVKEMKGGDQSLLEPILQAIKDDAVKEKAEAHFEGKAKGGYSLDSPLRAHAASLIAYGESGKDAELNGKLMTGFLARRRYGMWGNTQENVYGMMGVLESVGKGTGTSVPPVALSLNGKEIPFSSLESPDKQVRRVRFSEQELGLSPGAPLLVRSGPVAGGNLSLRLSYDVPLQYEDFSSKAQGFKLERSYETPEGQAVDLQAIALGSLIKVRLKVKAMQDYNYVAIDDKLPAGLEPLNTELQTTERVAQGELSQAAQKGLSLLSYKELRDHRAAFFADELPAGDYEFSYMARATTPGRFLRPAGRAEAMYATENFGTTATDKVVVK